MGRSGNLFSVAGLNTVLFTGGLASFPGVSQGTVHIIRCRKGGQVGVLGRSIKGGNCIINFRNLVGCVRTLVPARRLVIKTLERGGATCPVLTVERTVTGTLVRRSFSVAKADPIIRIFRGHVRVAGSKAPLISVGQVVSGPPGSEGRGLTTVVEELGVYRRLKAN